MIDNLNVINKLLIFESEDDFYHLQIIKRRKEHSDLLSNSLAIKTYYIRSTEYLNDKYDEIVTLCKHHNARACINLNRRSFEKIAFQTLRKVTEQIMNKDFKSVRKAYESVCGTFSNEDEKKWIIDIDDKDYNSNELILTIKNIEPLGEKLIARLETKNGYHLIVKPFNVSKLVDNKFDIHKDNPTILYIP